MDGYEIWFVQQRSNWILNFWEFLSNCELDVKDQSFFFRRIKTEKERGEIDKVSKQERE